MSFPTTVRSGASLALAALLLAPLPAVAADSLVLTPHVDVSQEYTDNVFYSGSSEQHDKITRITPSLRLSGRSESGGSSLLVGAQVVEYWRFGELDAVDPFVKADFTRDLTPRWNVRGDARWRKQHNTDAVSGGGDGGDIYGARPDVETTELSSSVTYRLTPSTTFSLGGAYFDVNYGSGSGNEFEGFTDYGVRQVQGLWQKTLSPVQAIGLVGTYQLIPLDSATSFGDTVRDARDDHIYRLAAQWTRSWSQRFNTRLEAGVRYLRTSGGAVQNLTEVTEFGPDPNDPLAGATERPFDTTPDPSFAFVGEANFDYTTKHGRFNLHLSRETRPDNGSQGSRDVDRAVFTFDRRFGRRVRLNTYVSYTNTTTSGEVTQPVALEPGMGCSRVGFQNDDPICLVDFDSALDEEFWGAGIQLSYRLRRNWSAYLSYAFQSFSDDLPEVGGRDRDWNANRVSVGLRWSHDVPL